MGKKILIFIVLVVLAAGIGVGAYFVTSKDDNKNSDSQETSGTAKLNGE